MIASNKMMMMKPAAKLFAAFAVALAVTFCLLACQTEEDSGGNTGISARLPVRDGSRSYYSLSTGRKVDNPAGTGWDLALESHNNSFFILTNSGVTALETNSGGQGGVWYTEKTNFASAGKADAVTASLGEYEPYTADVYRWAMIMAAEPVKEILNVITYLGYPSGGGTSAEDFFNRKEPDQSGMASFVPYNFDKKQAYTMRGMPPSYTPTKRVYIVRHGDGVTHSKIQLSEVYLEPGDPSQFVLRIKHELVE
jgi:hypothetical protein